MKPRKLTPAQVRALRAIVDGERIYVSGATSRVLIAAGLVEPATDIYMLDGRWTSYLVPTIDAPRALGL